MASQIDPTLDGKLDEIGAAVPKPELKQALTAARDEITALQAESGGGGDPIPVFSADTAGLVPASGGGTANFLRADGDFAEPPGGGGGDGIPAGVSQVAIRDETGAVQMVGSADDGTVIIEGVEAATQLRAVAILGATTFAETAVAASRELTDADAADVLSTPEGLATRRQRQVLRPLHGTPSTAIVLSIPANIAHGTEILVRRPGDQTGAVTVDLVGAGSLNGGTDPVTIPRKRLFAIYVSNVVGNSPTVETSITLEDTLIEVVSASGALTLEAHNERQIVSSGNITIPGVVGLSGCIVAGGAHTITFNSLATATLAAGDMVPFVVRTATVIDAVLIPNADRLAFS